MKIMTTADKLNAQSNYKYEFERLKVRCEEKVDHGIAVFSFWSGIVALLACIGFFLYMHTMAALLIIGFVLGVIILFWLPEMLAWCCAKYKMRNFGVNYND